jgi:chorismate lyase/3-hydroxybenzoate synthase
MLAIRKTDMDPKMLHSGGLDLRQLGGNPLVMEAGEHVLALMDFGSTQLGGRDFGIPLAPLDPSCKATAWISDQAPRVSHPLDHVTLTQTDHLLFGTVRLPSERIEQATKLAYRSIQKTIQQHPGFRLIRLWNFFPRINGEDEGIERYRLFSRARHDVLASSGYRMSSDLPAASAVGSKEGPLVIHFLAGNGDMTTLENPRQVSAYRYPRTYGPRSPSFSRAVIHSPEQGRQLFLSGTASIIGHETIAPSDPEMQTRVTLDNLSALLECAHYPSMRSLGSSASWVVYIRDPAHIDQIRPLITDHIHPDARIVYLQGDICRKDLMVEIEGTIFC